MALEGLHHITAITADAPRNVDFHARVLGLRLVKKTVNFDQPDVYHLYFGDERGTPGSILTFFEFPGAALGQAGDGMVHTIQWRVASDEALDFWAARLADRLEREGLIRRESCSSDARGAYAVLTEAGVDMLGAARTTHLAGVRSLFLQHFSDDELDVLGDAWDRVVPGSASAPGPTCG